MNIIAEELNATIRQENAHVYRMLSGIGRQLFFPKGILTQSAEAKEKAYRINATAGIAKQDGGIMHFGSVMTHIPDFPPETSINYAPSYGLPELREVWKDSVLEKNPSLAGTPVSLPVVTSGITHAIAVFADMWVDPEDVVILPDMMWGNYNMIFVVRRGASISRYPIFTEDGAFNTAAFEERIAIEAGSRSKIVVLLNFPHNPSGYTVSEAEADRIRRILVKTAESGTDVVAVTDDSYFGLFYDDECIKESMFARLCGAHERLLCVKLDGATKENFVWGLRVGFCTYGCTAADDVAALYEALEKKTAGCVRGTVSNGSHLGQQIVLSSMKDPRYQEERREKFEILKSRALKVKSVLAAGKYQAAWDVYPFNSGYFMCLKLKTVDAETLRCHLLDAYGVGLIAIGDRDLRVAFSCVEESEIEELFDIILQGVNDLS